MGINLKKTLKSRGIKQAELAKMIDVSPGYVSELAAGKKRPSMDTLDKIAAAIGASVGELYDESPTAATSTKQMEETLMSGFAGFAEPRASEFIADKRSALLRGISLIFPQIQHVSTYKLSTGIPEFSIALNDILVVELNGKPAHGDLVIANIVDMTSGEAKTVVRRPVGTLLIPGNIQVQAEDMVSENPTCAIVGTIKGIIRTPEK